ALNAIVQAVGDEDVALAIDSETGGPVELSRGRAGGAPGAQIGAFTIKDLDVVAVFIANVDLFLLIDGDGGGPSQLPIGGPEGSELSDVPLVDGTDRDAQDAHWRVAHVGAIEDVEAAVSSSRQVDRVIESSTALGQLPDG